MVGSPGGDGFADGRPATRVALGHAARGWHVFPLLPGMKRPAVRNWPEWATTDPDRIARHWDPHPDHGVGIACGPSRLLVVDLDDKDGRNGSGEWFKLLDRHQVVGPDTYTVETPSGGLHRYFTAPEAPRLDNTAGRLAAGIDTRADGGYVVAADTRLAGGSYRALVDTPPAPAPAWLVQALTTPARGPVAAPPAKGGTSRYGQRALDAEAGRVATAPDGARNHTLNRAAFNLGQLVAGGEVDFDDAIHTLELVARRAGLEQREIVATIRSGLAAGIRHPRAGGRRR